MRLILASASPRRVELIKQIENLQVQVCPSNALEQANNFDVKEYVKTLAYIKASNVFAKQQELTLGADTIVCFGNKILGKPKNNQQAVEFLKMLSGVTHSVYTGVCLINKNKVIKDVTETKVTFNEFSDDFITNYIKTGSPFDKAGGYGIQDDMIKPMIKNIDGDLNNVIGLPVAQVRRLIEENF